MFKLNFQGQGHRIKHVEITQVNFQSSSTSGWNVLARLNRPSTELQNSEMIICYYFMFTVFNRSTHQRKILVSKKQWELKNYL